LARILCKRVKFSPSVRSLTVTVRVGHGTATVRERTDGRIRDRREQPRQDDPVTVASIVR